MYRAAPYELQGSVWRKMAWHHYIGLRWTAKDKVEAKWKILPLTCPVICGNHIKQQSLKAKTIPKFENNIYRVKIIRNAMPQSAFLFLTRNSNVPSQQSQRPEPFILPLFHPDHEIEMHFVKVSFNIIPHSWLGLSYMRLGYNIQSYMEILLWFEASAAVETRSSLL